MPWKPAGRATTWAARSTRPLRPTTSTPARPRSTAAPTKSSATSSRRPFSAYDTPPASRDPRPRRPQGKHMNFEFSDDEQQLSEAVQRFVERGYSFERRTAIAKAGGFSAEAWGEIAELGLLGLGTSEEDGGMAMGPVAAMLAVEALGRGLVLEPVAAVALVAASVLARAPADVRASWSPRVASGDARVVLAYQERAARYRLD